MAVEYETESGDRWLWVKATSTNLLIEVGGTDPDDESYLICIYPAQIKELREFLHASFPKIITEPRDLAPYPKDEDG